MYFCCWLNCTRNIYGNISLKPFYKTWKNNCEGFLFAWSQLTKFHCTLIMYISSQKMFIVDFMFNANKSVILQPVQFWEDYDVKFSFFCRNIGAIMIKVLMFWVSILGDYLMFKPNISCTNIWGATYFNYSKIKYV